MIWEKFRPAVKIGDAGRRNQNLGFGDRKYYG